MTAPAVMQNLEERGRQMGSQARISLLLAALSGAGSAVTAQPILSMALVASAICFLAIAAALREHGRGLVRRSDDGFEAIRTFAAGDAIPCLMTDELGEVGWLNRAGEARFGRINTGEIGIASLLASDVPDPGPISLRLLARAEAGQPASEDTVLRDGHGRLSVHRVGANQYFWRFEHLGPRAGTEATTEDALPLITVGRNGTVLHMNPNARGFIGRRVKTIDQLFSDLPPKVGQVNVVATVHGPRRCLVANKRGRPGRDEIVLVPTPEVEGETSLAAGPDIAALPVPLMTVRSDGTILTLNDKARRLIAVEPTEGQKLWDHMEGLGRPIRDWLTEAAEGRDLQRTEFLRLRRPDRETFVQVTLARVDTAGQDSPILYVVLNDATELKTLEAQFVQSQKMQAIGQLAGGVAHDFNNLLTAITGHCDLLLLRRDQGDPEYADLMQINQNANRAAALVSQLLAFSRKQMLKAEPMDLRNTMADLTHLLNRLVGEKVELVLTHDPKLHQIRADKRQLEQVIMNLVVNSRDAMTEGGKILIETSNLSLSAPMERESVTIPAGEYVVVKVADEGPGIPVDKIGKVFEPFFTTKRMGEGTGLGLSTAFGIVKQTGGYIFVASEPGQGAEFTMLFPALVRRPGKFEDEGPEPVQVGSLIERHDGVILLVEDEAPVRAFASRALKLRGYTVLEAESAEAALTTLEDEAVHVDVFVTDVVMPGLDGPSWVRQALQRRPDTRVVFMSGYAEDALDGAEEIVANSVFLPKPFSLMELTETVARQIA